MKRILFSLVFLGAALSLQAQTFNPFPKSWKWTDENPPSPFSRRVPST